jgi:hypothetical protein
MSDSAQKKREQRARREAGIRNVQLGVHSEGWPELLVLHGCLAESDMEDWTAIVTALELFLEQARTGQRTIAVILRDRQTVLPEPKQRQNYKPKPQDRFQDPQLRWAYQTRRKRLSRVDKNKPRE